MAYEGLEDPLHPPEHLPSPMSALGWQVWIICVEIFVDNCFRDIPSRCLPLLDNCFFDIPA